MNAPPKKSYMWDKAGDCPGKTNEELCPHKKAYKDFRDKGRNGRTPPRQPRKEERREERKCVFCGKTGHKMSNCRYRKQEMEKAMAGILKDDRKRKRKQKRKRRRDSDSDFDSDDSRDE